MPLHPTFEAMYRALREDPDYRPTHQHTVEQARANYAAIDASFGPGEPVDTVEDRTIPGPGGELPIRIYRPRQGASLPGLLYLHGGGGVLGSLETHDRECRVVCNRVQCVVVAVDYRLAPEHPWPAASEDSWAALRWVHGHAQELGIDPTRLAVGGDSVGGNLAASTCIRARDADGPPLVAQWLLYPSVGAKLGDFPSHERNRDAPILPMETLRWFRSHYLGSANAQLSDPRLAPILADLRDLPPTTIVVAEYDPLHDEGVAYAERLQAAGVEVSLIDCPGLPHAFIHFHSAVPEAHAALLEASDLLAQRFAMIP